MRIFAIDPGNIQSAYCIMDAETLKPLEFAKIYNEALMEKIKQEAPEELRVAIEMVACYGMPVGREVFDTVLWIGRYYEAFERLGVTPELVYRMEEKKHICHDSRAKDSNIKRALIDRFAQHDLKSGKGTKKDPDFFYGFAADVWQAFAVGITYAETRGKKNDERCKGLDRQ